MPALRMQLCPAVAMAERPHKLADFWAHALGYVLEPGYDDPDGASIVDPAGKAPRSDGSARLKERRRRTGFTSTSGWQGRARGT